MSDQDRPATKQPYHYEKRIRYMRDENLPEAVATAMQHFAGSSKASLRRLVKLMDLMIQLERTKLDLLPVGSLSNEEIARQMSLAYGTMYGFKMVRQFAEDAMEDNLDPLQYPELPGFDELAKNASGALATRARVMDWEEDDD